MTNANNTTPKFPVLVLSEGDTMIYVFTEMNRPRKTFWDFYQNDKYERDIFIDSTGEKFKAVNVRFVKFGRFWGYNLHFSKKHRTTYIDFDWEPLHESDSLVELKNLLDEMARQKEDFWEEKFGDMEEMSEEVDKAKTYKELFMLFH